MKNRGFTLVELLVVSGIIAILAGIAFTGVRSARLAAIDARIQGEIARLAASAEMYYLGNDYSFDGVCESTDFQRVKDDVEELIPNPPADFWTCQDEEACYLLEVYLPGKDTGYTVDCTLL